MTFAISGVPVLLHSPANRDRPAPLILLWHGFGIPNSEHALADALPLEQVDAWKAYLGLPLFGQRFPGTEEIMRRQMEDYVLNLLLPVMEQAMQELPRVVEALQWHCNLASDTPVGLFGFSAGGLAALLTLAESDLPIQAAILLGVTKNLSAAVATFERYSQAMSSILKQQFPWVKPEQLTYTWSPPSEAARDRLDFVSRAGEIAQGNPLPPAILLMHAAQDETYDVGDAEILYTELQLYYQQANCPERLSIEIFPHLGHQIDLAAAKESPQMQAALKAMEKAIANWFSRYLQVV